MFILALLLTMGVLHYSGIGCPVLFITGFPCPGCGMTRAFIALLDFDIITSIHYHPLCIIVIIMFCCYILNEFKIIAISKRVKNISLVSILAMFIFVYIIRMIVMFPNTSPMLYNNDAIINKIYLFLGGQLC